LGHEVHLFSWGEGKDVPPKGMSRFLKQFLRIF